MQPTVLRVSVDISRKQPKPARTSLRAAYTNPPSCVFYEPTLSLLELAVQLVLLIQLTRIEVDVMVGVRLLHHDEILAVRGFVEVLVFLLHNDLEDVLAVILTGVRVLEILDAALLLDLCIHPEGVSVEDTQDALNARQHGLELLVHNIHEGIVAHVLHEVLQVLPHVPYLEVHGVDDCLGMVLLIKILEIALHVENHVLDLIGVPPH